jgi:hypothetical protein
MHSRQRHAHDVQAGVTRRMATLQLLLLGVAVHVLDGPGLTRAVALRTAGEQGVAVR